MLISSILDLVQINDLEVRCPSSHADCPWIGRLSSEESHLATCDYATVQCEHEGRGCAFRGERRSVYILSPILSCLTSHSFLSDHLMGCQHVLVACSHAHAGCSETPQRGDIASHLSSCSYRPVSCPNGCGSTLSFREVASHRSTVCPNEPLVCPHQEATSECTPTCEGRYRREALMTHMNSPDYVRLEIQQLRQRFEGIIGAQVTSVMASRSS